jgi:hypothetical protein
MKNFYGFIVIINVISLTIALSTDNKFSMLFALIGLVMGLIGLFLYEKTSI